MKNRNTFFIAACILFLSSCVVKSLNPFYTKKSISFDERFIGTWEDTSKGVWTIISVKDEMTKDTPLKKMKKSQSQLYAEYKNSYYIGRQHKGEESLFLATPFKINNQTFLDFYPLDLRNGNGNLLENHIVYTHSLVKYDVNNKGEIEIRWLDEDKIEALFREKKIKMKHSKVGALKDKYLLTASSTELEKFIEKYMSSEDEDKWETSTKYTLSKTSDTE
jgi:hypothetical protein